MAVFKKMSPGRFIVFGFASVIVLGAILLLLPISANEGVKVSIIDAFFTSTSAVCVTGLIVFDTADTFSVFGQTIIALLIQIGGLGVASIGVGFIILAGKKVSFKERLLVKESMNFNSMKGIVKLVKAILFMTLSFEAVGVILSFLVFSKDYPPLTALGISIFHSIAAFNNSGFDILGGFRSLVTYKDNVFLTLVTSGLVIFGGLGFYAIKDIIKVRTFKKFSLHTKIVITMTVTLLVTGTILIKLTEQVTWLGAFFYSMSARTAGFATYPLGGFSNAGLFLIIILMFIGASPGSTGGGIKTTTFFTLVKSAYSTATNKHCSAFKRRIPNEVVSKAFMVMILAVAVVCINTLLLTVLEPEATFLELFFEVTSAFGTVGLSTGITPNLCTLSKVIIILTMFIGRLGPLTMLTIWSFRSLSNVSYSEENFTVG